MTMRRWRNSTSRYDNDDEDIDVLIKTDKPTIDRLLVWHHKQVAETGRYNGFTSWPHDYMKRCKGFCPTTGTQLCFTRSSGMHECGFFKNPDYNQCYHLSLSFFDPFTHEHRDHDHELAGQWCDAFFGRDKKLLWIEAPHSDHGRQLDVRHYRLLMDEHWSEPIKPRGEVYTREFTAAKWKSWSDVQYEREQRANKMKQCLGDALSSAPK